MGDGRWEIGDWETGGRGDGEKYNINCSYPLPITHYPLPLTLPTPISHLPSKKSLHSIDRPVLDGFGNVGGFDVFASGEIGDGAGDFDNAIAGSGGES